MSATMTNGRDRVDLRAVQTLARRELRESMRDRWFWLYVAGFAALAVALTSLTFDDARAVGAEGFSRTGVSLVALAQLVVPLMGLTMGARSIAGPRERGTLHFLLAHPVSRSEVFLGTYLGSVVSMLAAVASGFGVAGLVAAARSDVVDPADLLVLAVLAWLLAVAMVGVGVVVSVVSRRSATAIGVGLFAWLLLVLVGDLGLMGTAVATRLPVGALFFAAVANPAESFRLTAVEVLQGSLDVLGPVGSYAVERFGGSLRWVTGAALAAWAVLPALVGLSLFRRRGDL